MHSWCVKMSQCLSVHIWAAPLHRLNHVVFPAACRETLASWTFNLPLNQFPPLLFHSLWGGWTVWPMIPFHWRALRHLFGHVAGSTINKWLVCWCSPSCYERTFHLVTTTCVCSGMKREQSAHPDFHVCPLYVETCILVTKEATFPLCRIWRVRIYSPQKPPHQAAQISQTENSAATRLVQKVNLCLDARLWTAVSVAGMATDCAVAWECVWAVVTGRSSSTTTVCQVAQVNISRPSCFLEEVSMLNLILLGQAGALGWLQQGFWWISGVHSGTAMYNNLLCLCQVLEEVFVQWWLCTFNNHVQERWMGLLITCSSWYINPGHWVRNREICVNYRYL